MNDDNLMIKVLEYLNQYFGDGKFYDIETLEGYEEHGGFLEDSPYSIVVKQLIEKGFILQKNNTGYIFIDPPIFTIGTKIKKTEFIHLEAQLSIEGNKYLQELRNQQKDRKERSSFWTTSSERNETQQEYFKIMIIITIVAVGFAILTYYNK
jgi:hypothetical protein